MKKLVVHILEVRNLRNNAEKDAVACYALATFNGRSYATKVIEGQVQPHFDEEFLFPYPKVLKGDALQVQVLSCNSTGPEGRDGATEIGHVSITADQFASPDHGLTWFPLLTDTADFVGEVRMSLKLQTYHVHYQNGNGIAHSSRSPRKSALRGWKKIGVVLMGSILLTAISSLLTAYMLFNGAGMGSSIDTDPTSFITSEYLGTALALLQANRLHEAVALLEIIVSTNRRSNHAWLLLGLAYSELGMQEAALTACETAAAINSSSVHAISCISRTEFILGNFDRAVLGFKKVAALDPNSLENLDSLGAALLEKGEVEEAKAILSEAVARGSTEYSVHYNLGVCQAHFNETKSAMTAFQRASQFNPKHAESHFNYGMQALKFGALDESVISFQLAVNLNNTLHEGYTSLGLTYEALGDASKAMEYYQAAINLNPDTRTLLLLGRLQFKLGFMMESLETMEYAGLLDPQCFHIQYNKGLVYEAAQENTLALGSFLRAKDLNPKHQRTFVHIGILQHRLGMLEDAIESLGHAIKMKKDDKHSYQLLRLVLKQQEGISLSESEQLSAESLSTQPPVLEVPEAKESLKISVPHWVPTPAPLKPADQPNITVEQAPTNKIPDVPSSPSTQATPEGISEVKKEDPESISIPEEVLPITEAAKDTSDSVILESTDKSQVSDEQDVLSSSEDPKFTLPVEIEVKFEGSLESNKSLDESSKISVQEEQDTSDGRIQEEEASQLPEVTNTTYTPQENDMINAQPTEDISQQEPDSALQSAESTQVVEEVNGEEGNEQFDEEDETMIEVPFEEVERQMETQEEDIPTTPDQQTSAQSTDTKSHSETEATAEDNADPPGKTEEQLKAEQEEQLRKEQEQLKKDQEAALQLKAEQEEQLKKDQEAALQSAKSYVSLGKAYLDKGKIPLAIKQFQKVINKVPEYWEGYYYMGLAQQAKKDHDKCIDNLLKAVALQEEGDESLQQINDYAKQLMASSLYDQAKKIYEGLSVNSSSVEPLINLAEIHESQKEYEAALQILNEVSAKDPSNAHALGEIGKIMILMGESASAKSYLEKAMQLDPNNVKIIVNSGTALHSIGEISKAKEMFKHALNVDPEHPQAHLNLAIVLHNEGETEEALTHFQKASQLGVKHPMIDSALAAAGSSASAQPGGTGAVGGGRPPPRWLGRAKGAFGAGSGFGGPEGVPAAPPQPTQGGAGAYGRSTTQTFGGGGTAFAGGLSSDTTASSPSQETEGSSSSPASDQAGYQSSTRTIDGVAEDINTQSQSGQSLSGLSSGGGKFGARQQAGISGLRI